MLPKDKIILDYGCGRGYDVEHLKEEGFNIKGFDPNGKYNNFEVFDVQYDIIMCNYVFNVIEDMLDRYHAEQSILHHLKEGGTAYVAVRNDPNVAGGCTSTGTWQGYVQPVSKKWELIAKNSKFKMWKLTK
jgi:SAM-dependent methyltransferase